ncbi:MAG: hemerythrin domain-containing protein [Nanoarchaeota archaeon]
MPAPLIKALKAQHREILSLFDALAVYMAGEAVPTIEVMLNLKNLKALLLKHVELENKSLYPELNSAKDRKIRETAKIYSEGMLKIGQQVFAFFDQYLHLKVSELQINEKFKMDLKQINLIVAGRIKAEEKILFPLYGKRTKYS